MNCVAAILVLMVASAAGEDIKCRACLAYVVAADKASLVTEMQPIFDVIMEKGTQDYKVCPTAGPDVVCGAGEECVSARASAVHKATGEPEYTVYTDKAACAAPSITCEAFMGTNTDLQMGDPVSFKLASFTDFTCEKGVNVWGNVWEDSSASTNAPVALLLLAAAYIAM